MAIIKQAQVPPANLKDMIVVTPALPTSGPPVQNDFTGLSQSGIGPSPSVLTTAYDNIRQWIRPGMPQFRIFPLPVKSNLQANAAINSAVVEAISSTSFGPALPPFSIQFNNAGVFGGNPNFTFNPNTLVVTLSIPGAFNPTTLASDVYGNLVLNNGVVFTPGSGSQWPVWRIYQSNSGDTLEIRDSNNAYEAVAFSPNHGPIIFDPTSSISMGQLFLVLPSYTAVSDSPILVITGSYESTSSPTYAADYWAIQSKIGSGLNGTSTLTISHSGGTSGLTFVQLPSLILPGTLTDSTGSVGTLGQLLSSNVTGTKWVAAASGSGLDFSDIFLLMGG